MKSFLSIILIIVIITSVFIVTCPSREAHIDTIMKEVNILIDNEFSNKTGSENEKAIALFTTALCSGITETFIDKKLYVENYFLFNVGIFIYEGEENIISVGFLNHVFTDLSDKIKERLPDL